jgi:hypothetical protein
MSLARNLTLFGVLVGSTPAAAEDSFAADVFQQVSSDYAECFAYHVLAKACDSERATQEQLAAMDSGAQKALEEMYHTGKAAGMSVAALLADAKLAYHTVATLTENEPCINFSAASVKYDHFCRDLERSPQQGMEEICNQLAQDPNQSAMCKQLSAP